jgi:hypothetical protein
MDTILVDCRLSVADRPQTRDTTWTCGGARTPATVPLVRSRASIGRHDVHSSLLPSFLPSSSLHARRGGKEGPCCCCELRRHRASSPSRCSRPDPIHSSAKDTNTSSIPYLSQLRGGKGHIAVSTTARSHRRSSTRRLTVASTAPCTSAFSSACSFFPSTRRCPSNDATANASQAGPERGHALPRHGHR